MKQVSIGTTGIEISVLGLGTVKLGRDQGVKYPEGFVIPDDKQATSLLSLASDLGINLLDTAPAYGNSEERLGKLLKGQRERWVICTKTGEEFENGLSRYDFSPEHTRFSIERSLRRLNTDYLDMVLIHSDGNDLDILNKHGTLETLQELKEQGLVRAIGMSTKTVEGGLLAAQRADIVMATYNLSSQDEKPVLDYCAEHGKTALIKKAFASGHLCADGEDPARKSLEFVFGHPGASSVIIGTINPDHLRANADIVNQLTR
jgi:aryl-alcohol dehydrogenase-like predicted oxidoreductase